MAAVELVVSARAGGRESVMASIDASARQALTIFIVFPRFYDHPADI
jgi:hypothetical protein